VSLGNSASGLDFVVVLPHADPCVNSPDQNNRCCHFYSKFAMVTLDDALIAGNLHSAAQSLRIGNTGLGKQPSAPNVGAMQEYIQVQSIKKRAQNRLRI
jgi:hypothetical protein